MPRTLDSGKEVVRTTHGEKYWGGYLAVFLIALNLGYFHLTDYELNIIWVPIIANAAFWYFGNYTEALNQDPAEFSKPGTQHKGDDGTWKPTHSEWSWGIEAVLSTGFVGLVCRMCHQSHYYGGGVRRPLVAWTRL